MWNGNITATLNSKYGLRKIPFDVFMSQRKDFVVGLTVAEIKKGIKSAFYDDGKHYL